MSAFIITFRETLEAALIIGLLLSIVNVSYKNFGKAHLYIFLWSLVGVLLSWVFAYLFFIFFWWFEWKIEKIYEWCLMFIAFLMITHLLFWNRKLQSNIKKEAKTAIWKSKLWVLFFISFFSVVREWVETVIFFDALNISNQQSSVLWWSLWVIWAILLSIIAVQSAKKVNIKKVFMFSNLLLLFIAAWLLAHWIVEFQWAWLLPTYIKPIFDLSHILSEKEGIGSLLKAMFWYDANPSLLAIIAYFTFLGFACWKLRLTRFSK